MLLGVGFGGGSIAIVRKISKIAAVTCPDLMDVCYYGD